MPLIKPPDLVRIPKGSPCVFLVGPIQGSADWQNPTGELMVKELPGLFVSSPRSEMWPKGLSKEEHERRYALQAGWEHHMIETILLRMIDPQPYYGRGAIMAWCAKEVEHNPKRAYAQTTRFELGSILGFLNAFSGKTPFSGTSLRTGPRTPPCEDGLFIGADPEFSGRTYFEFTFPKLGRPLFSSLDETIEATLRYLRNA